MSFLEKDLEDIIYLTPSCYLRENGLEIFDKKIRQKRIGEYGVSDIIAYKIVNGELYIQIFELKKDIININTILQVYRYKQGVSSYLIKRGLKNFKIKCIVIGRDIDSKNDDVYLYPNLKMFEVYLYDYEFTGLFFELYEPDFILTNEGFKL